MKECQDPAQNIPRAALASSDILSGVHGGDIVISASTFSIPSIGSITWRICSSIMGPIGQPIVVKVYSTWTVSPSMATS